MNKTQHNRLGEIEILLETEFGINKMTYVSSYQIPFNNPRSEKIEWRKSSTKHYYAIWGNVEDLNTRGITHITTKSGRIPKNPAKYFFQLLESSKNLKYKR